MTQTPAEPDRNSSETDAASGPSNPPQAEPTVTDRPKAPDLKTPSGTQRVRYSLLSPETRTGRFLRGTLRVLALVVGLFALGLLSAYLLLYRPTQQELKNANLQATQSAAEIQKIRADLSGAQQNLQTSRNQAEQAKSQLETEVARVQVLRAINAVTLAQMAVQGGNKAGAVKALDTAQGYLQAVQPLLQKRDSQQISTLLALFTLAKNDLDRDLKLAGQDLERLQSELQRAESNVLK
jgi:hypothetical protein